eukprot:COSAG02_NODE_2336_length_9114_cov_4.097615_7_plen_276_part_00
MLSSNSLQQLPDTPDSAALRELRLDGNRIRQAGAIVNPERTTSGLRLRLLDLSGNPLDDSDQTIESLSRACMQLEILSLNAPAGVEAESILESQWAAALHHLPRLKTLNGKKWKRDKAKAPAPRSTAPVAHENSSTAATVVSGEQSSQLSVTTSPTAAKAEALRAVLRGLSQEHLAALAESLEAGVNLTKQLRKLHVAESAGADSNSDVHGSGKRRLQSPSHSDGERDAGAPGAASRPISAKKAAKRLAKKLGRAPTEAEIAGLIAKRQKKANER